MNRLCIYYEERERRLRESCTPHQMIDCWWWLVVWCGGVWWVCGGCVATSLVHTTSSAAADAAALEGPVRPQELHRLIVEDDVSPS